ncbi:MULTISPECIES: CaiB/BaiF CoA transferase family protein [unclassified Micromonospora]|uniref:CaiB/BaiF CoA transferase family protein n=1 Tax=Micromonospora sp. NPDC005087 TaxID=3364225 RepID=UPI00369E9592
MDSATTNHATAPALRLPLAGVRVLDYAQYVAGPLATMLLADLGADVVKVEGPGGDAWRHYEPHAPGQSNYFYSLNRNKRSVMLDLKTAEGRAASDRLIATADAVVHNLPPARAAAFGLDRDNVRRLNPRAVYVSISAFGSQGPDSGRLGYDLIAQALSGLLMADVRVGDEVPRRSGGIPMADLTTGLLAAISVLAGLHQRASDEAPGIEVSLLGAALTTQVQRFVRLEQSVATKEPARPLTRAGIEATAKATAAAEELEPYYRCYETADGYIALACLNVSQRRHVLEVLGLDDPWVENPQAAPANQAERSRRLATHQRFVATFQARTTAAWITLLGSRNIPVGEVRQLSQLFDDQQVQTNGLVQCVQQPGVGPVRLLGNLFMIDGVATPAERHAPGLGEHTREVLDSLPAIHTIEGGRASCR